jgi:hypothetical protein
MNTLFSLLSALLSIAVLVLVAIREVAWSKRYRAARDAEAIALKARLEMVQDLTSPRIKEHYDATKVMLEDLIKKLEGQKLDASQTVKRLQMGMVVAHITSLGLAEAARERARTIELLAGLAVAGAASSPELQADIDSLTKLASARTNVDVSLALILKVIEILKKNNALAPEHDALVQQLTGPEGTMTAQAAPDAAAALPSAAAEGRE